MRALILAGGSGTRFWPLSRRLRPKQLLALDGERSLLQSTVDRLAPRIDPQNVWICTTEELAEPVRGQLPEVPAAQVLAEPTGRNTAPAIGWSLRRMQAESPDTADDTVAVLPADHRMADAAAFRAALGAAARLARRDDRVLTLGVRPRWAETGYGYLELGAPIPDHGDGAEPSRAHTVERFCEKPDLATAESWLAGGDHLWNAGIFVFRAPVLLDHLERLRPQLAAGLAAIAAQPERTAEIYPTLESISIDYAVMEQLDDIATVTLDAGWSDLGSWEALAEILDADLDGNRIDGDALLVDARDNLVRSEGGTVALLGVEGLAVVRTGDAVLVVPRERSQDVRRIVERLRADGRDDLL
ncbi:MAG: sugar phosphate nucleotidyltransferase [Acidobacteriota bacterium]